MRPEERDAALSRVIDRSESLEDWRRLAASADADPEVWRELVQGLRAECALRTSGDELERRVAALPLPPPRMHAAALRRLAASLLVLACLTGAFLAGRLAGTPHGPGAGPAADEFAEVGVVGELVPEVLEAREAEGGGYEILYVRRTVHLDVVEDLYEVGLDEHALPAAHPANLAAPSPEASF